MLQAQKLNRKNSKRAVKEQLAFLLNKPQTEKHINLDSVLEAARSGKSCRKLVQTLNARR